MRVHPAHQRLFEHVVFWVVALLALTLGSPALAQDTAVDEDTLARQRLEAALMERLSGGGLSREALASVYLRLGLLRTGAEAEEALGRALALNPEVEAPDVDDALRALLDARRAEARALRIALSSTSDSGQLTISIEGAPPGLVRMLELNGRAGFSRSVTFDGEPRSVRAPDAALPLQVRALDEYGNLVGTVGPPPIAIEVTERIRPAAAAASAIEADTEPESSPETESDPDEERPPSPDFGTSLIESPLFWVLVGLVVAGVAVGVGFSASGDRFVLEAPVIR